MPDRRYQYRYRVEIMLNTLTKKFAYPLFAGTIALSMVATDHATAAELLLTDEPYQYITVDQSLPNVLRAFGSNLGFSVQVSPGVSGQVRGRLPEMSQREFLEFLSRTYSLVWYYDGFVLHVENARESQSKVFRLGALSPDRLEQSLRDLNIWDPRFSIKSSPGSDLTYVSGPKRYVELVEDAIVSLGSNGSGVGIGALSGNSERSASGVEIIYGTQ
ncbi:hypothetical protein AB833_08820 [Chromatiales bacterium (ex Bugula neritina AB1)]|nr:hypothetical protein AB833_08820 [Chromatiales bacterium (ex Bugula neritina AB1)]